jgi:inosose dehydratase
MNQQTPLTRRAALRAFSAAALAAPLAQAAPARRLKPGQTSINWGFRVESAEPGVRDSAKLGYWGYESYGDVLEAVEEKIGWQRLLDQYNIPMPSSYFNFNLTDPTVRKDQVAKAIRMGNILKKCGGKTVVIGPNPVKRPPFDFNASKADIAATLNEVSKALEGIGLVAALHQHTGMCIDTRDEVYAIFDAVDTRVVKFGPDVGQLQKAGTDPVKVLKDFQSLLRTVHLKDFAGERAWAGYCPLGQGKADLPAVLDLLEAAKGMEYVMVELDMTGNAPMPPFECAQTSKQYLIKQGYKFRS